MEAEAALKAVREAATTADKQRHSTKAELEEMKERSCPAQHRFRSVAYLSNAAAAGTG